MRTGSAPNFCPPVEEGLTIELEDAKGAVTAFEFIGLILHNDRRYGVFFPLDDSEVGDSGEVVILEVIELDEDGQPAEFEFVEDEGILEEVFADFREATKDLYDFL